MSDDVWVDSATKLCAELATAGVELTADEDVITRNAGDWFVTMNAKARASVIATMLSLARQRKLTTTP